LENSVAVCWMLTENDDTGQGGHTGYLRAPHVWRAHDPDLFDGLRQCVQRDHRSVHCAEVRLVPGARYHSELVPSGLEARSRYFSEFVALASGCPLVFYDPDAGPSPSRGPRDLDDTSTLAPVASSRAAHRPLCAEPSEPWLPHPRSARPGRNISVDLRCRHSIYLVPDSKAVPPRILGVRSLRGQGTHRRLLVGSRRTSEMPHSLTAFRNSLVSP